MRIIAFINEKGGTCKTTLCVNVGAWLAAEARKRVLIVDLDTQGHAGKSLGIDVRGLRPTVFDLLSGTEVSVESAIHPTGIAGLDVMIANKELAGFPLTVAAHADRARKLQHILATPTITERYDLVLLDAPPSLSLATENALVASTELVVPVALTYLALDGCAEMVASVDRIRAEYGTDLRVAMVVPALPRRTLLADAILEKLRERFPQALAETALGFSVKIDEAQSHGRTIFEHAPRSSGAKMVAAIASELLARLPVAVARARSAALHRTDSSRVEVLA